MTSDTPDAPQTPRDTRTKFVRYELKIVLTTAEAERVRDWCLERFDTDEFGDEAGTYEVRTLYLDSPDLEIYHRTGEDRGTKFRIRRYGDEGQVWLERKRRRGTRVKKRRAEWPLAQLREILEGRASSDKFAEVFQEAVQGRSLQPVLLVVYPRSAFAGQGSERVTLDWGVKVWKMAANDDPFDPPGDPLTVTDDVVLELKYDDDVPPSFEELMAHIGRDPSSFSKYGRGVELVGLSATTRKPEDA